MRSPDVGSIVQLTVDAYTIDENANEVGLPPGTTCRVVGRRLVPEGHPEGLQFELQPLSGGRSFFMSLDLPDWLPVSAD